MQSFAPEYRPHVDGLRALAVASVVLFHLGIAPFSGGFVGVDVFFVISGYLITRLIAAEVRQTGTLRFGRFYLRRFRRLFPAFAATLIATFVAATFILGEADFLAFAESTIHAFLSVANFHYWALSGYFDSDAFQKPLLHTWSLSVEEQFYLLWPLVLFLLLRRTRPPWAVVAIAIAAAISLDLNLEVGEGMVGPVTILAPGLVKWLAGDVSSLFYLLPFRVFEFALGAMLVWAPPPRTVSPWRAECLSTVGLAAIVAAAVAFDGSDPFPSWRALVPCLGAVLVIRFGEARFTGMLLRNPASVGLGRISYSVYLVHWPLIVLAGYSLGRPFGAAERVGIIALSVLLGFLLHRLIERPFRYPRPDRPRRLLFASAAVGASLLATVPAAHVLATGGWSWRPQPEGAYLARFDVKAEMNKRFRLLGTICAKRGWDRCYETVAGRRNVLVVGDSMAPDALRMAHDILGPKLYYVMSTVPGCPPLVDSDRKLRATRPNRALCLRENAKRFDRRFYRHVEIVVIDAIFSQFGAGALGEYLAFLKRIGIRTVIVVGPYITLPTGFLHRIGAGKSRREIERTVRMKGTIRLNAALREETRRFGYFYLDLEAAFCRPACLVFTPGGIPYTWDSFHFSVEFSAVVARHFAREVRAYVPKGN